MSRTETDSLGTIEVPDDAYWGAQTQRSLENFAIGGQRMPLAVIHALALIKKAAARVNDHLGELPPEVARLIEQAADEVLAGRHDEHADEQRDVDGAGARQGYGRGCDARGAARSAHASAVSSCCAKPSMVSQPNTARAPLVRAHSSPTWRFSIS